MKCKSCKREIPDNSIFCNWCGFRQLKDKKTSVKVPAAKQLPSGNWYIQLRKENCSVTAETEAKCTAKAIAIREGFIKGEKPENKTVAKVLDDYITAREGVLSPLTIRGYYIIRNNRFQKYMQKPIASVNWQKAISEESKKSSAKTVKNSWFLIKSAAEDAGIELSRVTLPQQVKKEKLFLDAEQIPIFLDALHSTAAGRKCEIAALLALHSLRASEICALTWNDVDLERGLIHVHGAMVMDKSNKFILKDTNKNGCSNRYVPILSELLNSALRAVKVKEGRIYPQSPNRLYKQINAVLRDAGLPLVGVHGLRHSFASLCYHLQVPEKIAMQIGGWSDRTTMDSVYTHLSSQDIAKKADDLRAYFSSFHQ